MNLLRHIAIAGSAVLGYLNCIASGGDYPSYVASMRRQHPGAPILTEAGYWRERHAAADRNPASRCC